MKKKVPRLNNWELFLCHKTIYRQAGSLEDSP